MNAFRTRLALAACVLLGSISCTKTDQPEKLPPAVMPAGGGLQVALMHNYGFMSAAFAAEDGRGYGGFYHDTASILRNDYAPIKGVEAIQEFGRVGGPLGVRDFQRVSEGFRVQDREVFDSGTFEIAAVKPLPPRTLDVKGRYWTHWLFTDEGEWRILRDSLHGASR